MKKIIAIVLAAALLTAVLTGCSGGNSGKKVLNLYTWEAMFPDEVLDAFEKETGIEINYVTFDYDETMLAKLEAAGGGDYDLVIADDYIIEMAISENLVQKLDKSKLRNLGNVNPLYQGQFYDPNDEYTVPYGAGVQTIVYNPDAVSIDIKGYADLWDPSLADSVGVIANYRVINGMALKVMGESYNINDTAKIAAAGEKLNALAPNIRVIKDDFLQDDLLSGEISAAVMYTSQVTQAVMENPNLKVVYPSEGIGFGIMAGFIPSKAPNADSAYKFLDYILNPETAAACFEWLGYYCTTAAADSYISEAYRSFLTLPDSIDKANMEMIQNISAEADEQHALVWTTFQSLCG